MVFAVVAALLPSAPNALPPPPGTVSHTYRPAQQFDKDFPPTPGKMPPSWDGDWQPDIIRIPPPHAAVVATGWADPIPVPNYHIYVDPRGRPPPAPGNAGSSLYYPIRIGYLDAVWNPGYYEDDRSRLVIESYYYSYWNIKWHDQAFIELLVNPDKVRWPQPLPTESTDTPFAADKVAIVADARRRPIWYRYLRDGMIIPIFGGIYELRNFELRRVHESALPESVQLDRNTVAVPRLARMQLFVESVQRQQRPELRNAWGHNHVDFFETPDYRVSGKIELRNCFQTISDDGTVANEAELLIETGQFTWTGHDVHSRVGDYYQKVKAGDWLHRDEYAYKVLRVVLPQKLDDGREIVGWVEFDPRCRITSLADYQPPTDPGAYVIDPVVQERNREASRVEHARRLAEYRDSRPGPTPPPRKPSPRLWFDMFRWFDASLVLRLIGAAVALSCLVLVLRRRRRSGSAG